MAQSLRLLFLFCLHIPKGFAGGRGGISLPSDVVKPEATRFMWPKSRHFVPDSRSKSFHNNNLLLPLDWKRKHSICTLMVIISITANAGDPVLPTHMALQPIFDNVISICFLAFYNSRVMHMLSQFAFGEYAKGKHKRVELGHKIILWQCITMYFS